MNDKRKNLSWSDRMAVLRKELGRPLTLDELMGASENYRDAQSRGQSMPASQGEGSLTKET
jgi:hypothetical protein